MSILILNFWLLIMKTLWRNYMISLTLRKLSNLNTKHDLNVVLLQNSCKLIKLILKINVFKLKFAYPLFRKTDINIRSHMNMTRFTNMNLQSILAALKIFLKFFFVFRSFNVSKFLNSYQFISIFSIACKKLMN